MRNAGIATLVAVALTATASHAAERADAPNVVLILADDVGIEALGCYGGTSYDTPRLDALAESGTRFTHCYSMPVCHPTRIALLTGRYPFRLDHPGWGSFPKDAEPHTIAQAVKRAGYATAVAGKWQLALLKNDLDQPHRLGFDDYSLFGWHEGARYHDPLIWQNGELRDDTAGKYGPDLYVDFLADFFEEHRDRPFFAFYSMALCHDVTDDLDEPVPHVPGKDRYETYGEMVESMDAHVGQVVDDLDRLGLRENTLILFVGDNGTSKRSILRADENGKLIRTPVVSRFRDTEIRGGKGDLTDGGTHVPLIANWPGTVEAGAVVDDLVDFGDFYATIADLAGEKARPRQPIDGISFAGRLTEGTPSEREWAFAEHRGRSWVRTRRFKLYDDGELYEVRGRVEGERGPLGEGDLSPEEREEAALLRQALGTLQPE